MTCAAHHGQTARFERWVLPIDGSVGPSGSEVGVSGSSSKPFALAAVAQQPGLPDFRSADADPTGFGGVECRSVETSSIGDGSDSRSSVGSEVSEADLPHGEGIGTRRTKRKRSEASSTPSSAPEPSKASKCAVSFAKEVKYHDGLSEENQMFDDLVWNYCGTSQIRNSAGVLHHVQYDMNSLKCMIRLVHALERRVRQGPRKGVPVLPGGGGKGAKIGPEHLPVLAGLLDAAFEAVACLEERQAQLVPLDAEVSRAKRSRATPTSELPAHVAPSEEESEALPDSGFDVFDDFLLDAQVAHGDTQFDFSFLDDLSETDFELAEGLLAVDAEPVQGGGGGGSGRAEDDIASAKSTSTSFRIALPIQ